jgi:hypothetical protein
MVTIPPYQAMVTACAAIPLIEPARHRMEWECCFAAGMIRFIQQCAMRITTAELR